jgi:hypothetical protein
MHQELQDPQKYSAEVRKELSRLPNLATRIANRWYMGGPSSVRQLLMSGEYPAALKRQLEREEGVLDKPNLNHLAEHEKMELYGLSPGPP